MSTLQGHPVVVTGLAFSADSRFLVSGSPSYDNGLILWDVSSGASLLSFAGHPATHALAYSSDGTMLVSAGAYLDGPTTPNNNGIMLWDIASGALVGQPLVGHATWIHAVTFSPDSLRLASGSVDFNGEDNSIILWDFSLDTWLDLACRIANRSLTQREWDRYMGDQPYHETCPG